MCTLLPFLHHDFCRVLDFFVVLLENRGAITILYLLICYARRHAWRPELYEKECVISIPLLALDGKDVPQRSMKKTLDTRTTGLRLAELISNISNPLFVAVPTFLIIALLTAPDVPHACLWWLISILGISVAPFVFVLVGVRKGKLTDQHVSKREQRLVPLLFGLACTLLSLVLLSITGASPVLIATVVAVIVTCAISLIVTRYWKISLHLVGMAGMVTAFVLLLGPRLLVLSPLVLIVGWARWKVHAHTVAQAVAGTFLAVAVTAGVFLLFRV